MPFRRQRPASSEARRWPEAANQYAADPEPGRHAHHHQSGDASLRQRCLRSSVTSRNLESGSATMHVSCYGKCWVMPCSPVPPSVTLYAWRCAIRRCWEHFSVLSLEDDGERIWSRRRRLPREPGHGGVQRRVLPGIAESHLRRPARPSLPLLAARFEHPAPDYKRATPNTSTARWISGRATMPSPSIALARPARCRWPMSPPIKPWPSAAANRNIEFTGRQAWLGRIRQLLSAQLNAAPGLEGLAEQMRIARRGPCVGTSRIWAAAIRSCSMNCASSKAKQMLCEDQLPIYQIAEALGFSETASFRPCVVRWSGVAPSQFRP